MVITTERSGQGGSGRNRTATETEDGPTCSHYLGGPEEGCHLICVTGERAKGLGFQKCIASHHDRNPSHSQQTDRSVVGSRGSVGSSSGLFAPPLEIGWSLVQTTKPLVWYLILLPLFSRLAG